LGEVKTGFSRAFTLVELIVVISILAILWTIAFISLQNYSKDARDIKRLSDVRNLIGKITIENTKWVDLSQLITTESWYSMEIYWEDDNVVVWTPRFENLNENSWSFVDLSNESWVDPNWWRNYLFAYSVKTRRVAGMYKSETTWKNVCIW
jgi:prepilin-type N-terminal cleavage/methylation domain-containing protein